MGWFGRKKNDNPYGYVDNAALDGVGGYEPADAADATPQGVTVEPSSGDSGRTGSTGPTGSVGSPGSTQASAPPPPVPQRPAPQQSPSRPTLSPTTRVRIAQSGCAVVVAIIAGLVALLSSLGDDDTSSDDSYSDDTTAPTTSATPETKVAVPPAIDGWRPVVGGDGEFAYDVPWAWLAEPETIHGWEDDNGKAEVTLSTSAFTGKDFCPSDDTRNHGGAGVTVVDQGDAGQAGRNLAERVADSAYSPDSGPKPRLDARPTRWLTLDFAGGKTAAVTELRVKPGAGDCLPDSAIVLTAAVPTGDARTAVLVAYADQGYADATTREELAKLVGSFRTVPKSDRHTITSTPTSR